MVGVAQQNQETFKLYEGTKEPGNKRFLFINFPTKQVVPATWQNHTFPTHFAYE